jgi:hypothetical protein
MMIDVECLSNGMDAKEPAGGQLSYDMSQRDGKNGIISSFSMM